MWDRHSWIIIPGVLFLVLIGNRVLREQPEIIFLIISTPILSFTEIPNLFCAHTFWL